MALLSIIQPGLGGYTYLNWLMSDMILCCARSEQGAGEGSTGSSFVWPTIFQDYKDIRWLGKSS